MSENTNETANINIADIANAVNIIDYAASKGAFSGPDLELVGKNRNRLHAFVKANTPEETEESKTTTTVNEAGNSEKETAVNVKKASSKKSSKNKA